MELNFCFSDSISSCSSRLIERAAQLTLTTALDSTTWHSLFQGFRALFEFLAEVCLPVVLCQASVCHGNRDISGPCVRGRAVFFAIVKLNLQIKQELLSQVLQEFLQIIFQGSFSIHWAAKGRSNVEKIFENVSSLLCSWPVSAALHTNLPLICTIQGKHVSFKYVFSTGSTMCPNKIQGTVLPLMSSQIMFYPRSE